MWLSVVLRSEQPNDVAKFNTQYRLRSGWSLDGGKSQLRMSRLWSYFSLFFFLPPNLFFFSFPSPIQVGLAGILDKLIKGAWMLVPILCLGKWVQDAASTDSGDFGVILAPLGHWTAHSSACGFAFQRPCLEAEQDG